MRGSVGRVSCQTREQLRTRCPLPRSFVVRRHDALLRGGVGARGRACVHARQLPVYARSAGGVQVFSAAALLWLGRAAGLERLDADVVRFLAQRGLSPPAMDLDQVERTKRHYDAHAKAPAGSRKDALRHRQQVPPRPCRFARPRPRPRPTLNAALVGPVGVKR